MTAGSPAARPVSGADVVLKSFAELNAQELYGILQLRSTVFVVEQDCVYLDTDGIDVLAETIHAFVPRSAVGLPAAQAQKDSHGGDTGVDVMPVAYARLLPSGLVDGPAGRPAARSIGRVVSSPAARATGAGKAVFDRLVADYGPLTDLSLNAQSYAQGFYSRQGFEVSGPEFIEDGIPHVPMYRPRGPVER